MTHLELEEIEKLANAVDAPDDWYTGAELQGVFGDKGNTYDCAYIAKMSPSTADRMVKRIRELECEKEMRDLEIKILLSAVKINTRRTIRAALAVSGKDVGK